MPGPLSSPHAKLEQDCANCHEAFDQTAQDRLCIGCHKPIASDLADRRGFHGKNPEVRGSECRLCHSEHNGRDSSIISINRTLFDHGFTDFVLAGAHRDLQCENCHGIGKSWSSAPSTCVSCHAKQDPHREALGKACNQCHNENQWRQVAAFDHGQTEFPLAGRHLQVPCLSCHVGEIYKNAGTYCVDCHEPQDVHGSRLGDDCKACHTEAGWRPARFDHEKITGFPLSGSHAGVECATCHGPSRVAKLPAGCADCHAAQDVHKGQLGTGCANCHGTLSWRSGVRFDHGLTNFPLVGQHVAAACEACHATPAFKTVATTCVDCHRSDDIHKGRFASACQNCHTAIGWVQVQFDHGRQTSFRLTGRHAKISCYACHSKTNVKTAELPTNCFACHRNDDKHKGAFGQSCDRCHDTGSFKTARIPK